MFLEGSRGGDEGGGGRATWSQAACQQCPLGPATTPLSQPGLAPSEMRLEAGRWLGVPWDAHTEHLGVRCSHRAADAGTRFLWSLCRYFVLLSREVSLPQNSITLVPPGSSEREENTQRT